MDDLLDETDDEMPPQNDVIPILPANDGPYDDVVEIRAQENEPSHELPPLNDAILAENNESSDDVIEIGAQSNVQSHMGIITTGVAPIQLDNELSCEYSFITDVSFLERNNYS